MSEAHDHTHHHPVTLTKVNKLFIGGILLNVAFVIAELVAGISSNSLALVSDAGHNLSDVATLLLSLFAFRMTKRKASKKFTYGFHKSTILASLANAVILLIAVGSIGLEAVHRFLHPVATKGTMISIIAATGIVINAASAFLFFRDKEKDLNIKGAYLHMLTDALVSAGVVVAGILISISGLTWIDPLVSVLIMIVIVISTWGLLTESLRLALDAVPTSIDVEKVKTELLRTKGVNDIHHIHIWAMSTSRNAITAHVIIGADVSEQELTKIKHELKHRLEHLNIQHATLETERVACGEKEC